MGGHTFWSQNQIIKIPLKWKINLGRIYQNPGSSSYDSRASGLCAPAAGDSNLKRQLFVCGSLDTSQVLVPPTQATNPPVLVLSTTLDKLHLKLPFLLTMQHNTRLCSLKNDIFMKSVKIRSCWPGSHQPTQPCKCTFSGEHVLTLCFHQSLSSQYS